MPKPTSKPVSASITDSTHPLGSDLRFVWVIAKRTGECDECASPITPGDRICWDKHFHKAYCVPCGEEVSE